MNETTINLIKEVKELEYQLKDIWEEMSYDMSTTIVKSRCKKARKLSSEFARVARIWRMKNVILNNLPQNETREAYASYKLQKTTSR